MSSIVVVKMHVQVSRRTTQSCGKLIEGPTPKSKYKEELR